MSTLATRLAPSDEAELAEILRERHASGRPVHVLGGGSRIPQGAGDPLTIARISGVVSYSPGEMTLIARAGTPLAEIRQLLAAEGQALAFEPPDARHLTGLDGSSTLGGVVAANASGPRRLLAGACRDHLLGARFVDGRGRVLKTGGRVMKNVTGLDLSKLLAGSFGTLAVLTELSLKTLPAAQARATLTFSDLSEAEAVGLFATALATPYEVSGAAWHRGRAWLRIEGLDSQIRYRRDRLRALLRDRACEVQEAEASDALWRDLRDVAHFRADLPLWRILVKPGDAPAIAPRLRALGGDLSLDWGGGLIWYCGPGGADQVRAIVHHATLYRRGTVQGPAFPPQTGPVARLEQGLRRSFDPANILNPGLMDG